MAADVDLDNDVLTVNGTDIDEKIVIEAVTVYEYDDDGEIEDSEAGVRVTVRDVNTNEVVLDETFERDRVDELEVYGRAGDDWIENNTNIPSRLDGGVDDDALIGGWANDTLIGGEDDDYLMGRYGSNELFGGIGDDEYFYGYMSTFVSDVIHEDASVDEDSINFDQFYFGGSVTLDLAKTEWQTVNPEYLQLRLTTATGIENVEGSDFADTIYGNSRDNELKGLRGNDTLYGRTGNDELRGGDQNDFLGGDDGNDTLVGGAHNDTYLFAGTNPGFDEVIEDADADLDTLDFSGMKTGVDVHIARAGSRLAVDTSSFKLTLCNATAIENVIGTRYNDTITGNNRDNTLWGSFGNDTITGGNGADLLKGGDGVDQFWTDAADEVFGGLGLDRFDLVYEFFGRPNPRPGKYRDWGFV
jgi:Ca2+-binding RTX toxin-like protein